jgi:hypothetical protein
MPASTFHFLKEDPDSERTMDITMGVKKEIFTAFLCVGRDGKREKRGYM